MFVGVLIGVGAGLKLFTKVDFLLVAVAEAVVIHEVHHSSGEVSGVPKKVHLNDY